MKKIIMVSSLLILGLSTATGFVLSRSTQNMEVKVNAKDLPNHGLTIIKPSDSGFDNMAAALLAGRSQDEIESLKPFSVIVKNTGNRTVVAYTVIWECTEPDGRKAAYRIAHANSEALIDTEEYLKALARTPSMDDTIKPNTARLLSILPVGRGGGFGSQGEQNQMEQSQDLPNINRAEMIQRFGSELLRKYIDITVSIDGVFFDDGTFIGPDTTGFFDDMKIQVNAKRDLINSISEKLKLGRSKDEIFKDVEGKISSSNSKRADFNPVEKSNPTDYYNYFSNYFAAEILQLRRVYGDDKALELTLRPKKKPELVLRKIG
jgi:hypothetical protein